MFQVLDMELEIIRTVLKNDVNEISVCKDLKRDAGVFYTMVSISNREICKTVAGRVVNDSLFVLNRDFIGSFNYRDSLNLVFLYQPEKPLQDHVFHDVFAKRKKIAVAFLAACAESGLTGCFGELLIEEMNVNLDESGHIYFNYFLDFKALHLQNPPEVFFKKVARYIFVLLAREYQERFESDFDRYPDEIRLLYRKIQVNGFLSFNNLLTFMNSLPDHLHEKRFGLARLWERLLTLIRFFRKQSMTIFLTLVVLITVIYASYQITIRLSAEKHRKQTTAYIGMDMIGEVYMGEEDV